MTKPVRLDVIILEVILEVAERRAQSASGLPLRESSVPRPVLVFLAVSTDCVPMASLSDGGRGLAAGASVQAAARNFSLRLWFSLAALMACSGMPHQVLFFQKFQDVALGRIEPLYRGADVRALGFMFD